MTKRCIGSVELTGTTLSDGSEGGLVALGDLISGERQAADVLAIEQQNGYQVVPVTTATALGSTGGAAGDFLHKVLVPDATTQVIIKDGAVTVHTWTITASTEPNELTLNLICLTNWELTCTGAGATAIGRFS